jgi:type IV pilus assembly protein PilE
MNFMQKTAYSGKPTSHRITLALFRDNILSFNTLDQEESMKLQAGFTLLELMITVVVVAILTSIAVPSYTNYVKRGNAQEGPSNLLAMKTQAEQYYADHPATGYQDAGGNRGYACTPVATTQGFFDYTCTAPTRDTFTITATGKSGKNIAGWTYTINESGTRTSSGIDGAASTSCWITKSGGTC